MKNISSITILILFLSIISISCKSKKEVTENNTNSEESASNKLTEGIIEPSFKIFKKVCENEGDINCSFSPVSLDLAFAMLYTGTANNTQKEISDVLGFNQDIESFNQEIKSYYSELKHFEKDTTMQFCIANKIFLDKSFVLKNDYKKNILNYVGKELIESADFKNNARGEEIRINKWASETTKERIQNLIPQGSLNGNCKAVLANAIYFKSGWRYTFSEKSIEEKDFYINEKESHKVLFMAKTQKSGISYYQDKELKAIELPYQTRNISLIIILPNKSTIENINEFIPSAKKYNEICEKLTSTPVKIEIPKFKTESSFELSKILNKLGMKEVFNRGGDFSNMSDDKSLEVNAVLQKVFFEIDEKGSEAAAATAIMIRTTAMPQNTETKYQEFIANHPFIYILKENINNTPLFIGKYVK